MKLLLLIPEVYNLKTNFYTLKKNPKNNNNQNPQETTATKKPNKKPNQWKTAENVITDCSSITKAKN